MHYLLMTICKSTNAFRFYMDGVSLSPDQWRSLHRQFPIQKCLPSTDTGTHWHHRREVRQRPKVAKALAA